MEPEVSINTHFLNFLAWLKTHLRQVLQWTLIIVVVGLLLGWFIYNRSQREVRASAALSEVRAAATPGQPAPPESPEAYLKVASDFPGTKAAVRAVLEAGAAYFIQGKYADAQKQFERALKDSPESPWRAEAVMGLAASFEAQGKTNEAIARYEEVRKNATAAVADEAKLNLARLYEAQGKQVDALKMYDELVKAYPYSGLGAEAGMRLEDLTNRVPALGTNLMPVTPPMSLLTNRLGTNVTMLTNLQRMMTNVTRLSNPAPRVPGATTSAPKLPTNAPSK